MEFSFPFRVDGRGLTASTDPDTHVRDLIEQLLFTLPSERVNRPTLGSGVMQLVYTANSPELAGTTQFLIQGTLQEWLGDLVQIESLAVSATEGMLTISLQYLNRRSQQRHSAQLAREV